MRGTLVSFSYERFDCVWFVFSSWRYDLSCLRGEKNVLRVLLGVFFLPALQCNLSQNIIMLHRSSCNKILSKNIKPSNFVAYVFRYDYYCCRRMSLNSFLERSLSARLFVFHQFNEPTVPSRWKETTDNVFDICSSTLLLLFDGTTSRFW